MNRFVKLLNWEINRFAKFYVLLWLLTVLLQIIGLFVYVHNFTSDATRAMHMNAWTPAEFIAQFGSLSFSNYTGSLWYIAPIFICAAILLLYVFIVWYRDWTGKGTVIYRLLMLPTARVNVYLAKLAAIMLFVLGMIGFQVLLLVLEMHWFNAMISSDLSLPASLADLIQNHSTVLSAIIPYYFIQFILYYAVGLMVVTVLFTATLMERSFRLKGIVAGVTYCGLSVFVFILPFLIATKWDPNYFYPSEVVKMEIIAGIVVICGSLWLGSYLLRKRITV